MRVLSAFGLFLALPATAFPANDAEPKPLHWKIDGEKREAIVEFPDAKHKGPAPVVFVFHGHGTTMEAFWHRWNVQKHWPEAIGVYMQGLPTASRVDPNGKKAGWQSTADTEGDRDLKFFDAVLETVKKKHAVDPHRVFACGLSNGGNFAYVLWSTRSEAIAAVAPCASILHYPEKATLKPAAVLHIAGEKDTTAPYDMQVESMKKVREVNDCRKKPVKWGPGCELYPPKSKDGAAFISWIHPGGHGSPPQGFETIIKFFKEHPHHQGPKDDK